MKETDRISVISAADIFIESFTVGLPTIGWGRALYTGPVYQRLGLDPLHCLVYQRLGLDPLHWPCVPEAGAGPFTLALCTRGWVWTHYTALCTRGWVWTLYTGPVYQRLGLDPLHWPCAPEAGAEPFTLALCT